MHKKMKGIKISSIICAVFYHSIVTISKIEMKPKDLIILERIIIKFLIKLELIGNELELKRISKKFAFLCKIPRDFEIPE